MSTSGDATWPLPERAVPHTRSWWVDDHLMAGDYAGAYAPADARVKVQALLDAGVTCFLDLTTTNDPLEPYEALVDELGAGQARHVRVAVPDMTAPSDHQVREALRIIDDEAAAGGVTYVHCWGGIGRTGSIVGCYLARRIGGEAALAALAQLRRGSADAARTAPEMPDQVALVRRWARDPSLG